MLSGKQPELGSRVDHGHQSSGQQANQRVREALMFSNWFAADKPLATTASPEHGHLAQNPVSDEKEHTPSIPGPSTVRPASDVALSPHDAALEETIGKLQELREASITESKDDTSQGAREADTLAKNIYDPFNGDPIGLLPPGSSGKEDNEIWSHLAQVRDLQSEIARMHAQMEGIGDIDRGPSSKQVTSDDGGFNVEDEPKATQSAEFARLSDRFTQRKEAVEKIMLKVSLEAISYSAW